MVLGGHYDRHIHTLKKDCSTGSNGDKNYVIILVLQLVLVTKGESL